jgi:hypothetical protein
MYGLDIAETATHLPEAGELTAMIVLPTREVAMLQKGKIDMKAMKKLNIKFKDQHDPNKNLADSIN